MKLMSFDENFLNVRLTLVMIFQAVTDWLSQTDSKYKAFFFLNKSNIVSL